MISIHSVLRVLPFLAALLVCTPAWTVEPHVTYEPVNLQGSPFGSHMAGDLLITHHDGTVDLVPFAASSSGWFTSAPSELYPYSDVQMTVTYIGGGGGGPIVDPHLNGSDKELDDGRHPAAWACAAFLGLTRAYCSFDCRSSGGVSSWETGFCGAGATCRCQLPPPPPRGQQPPRHMAGAFVAGNGHLQSYIYSNFWFRP